MNAVRILPVDRFELVFAEDGDAMLCFIGRAFVGEGATATLDGSALVVDRGDAPSLSFVGLLEAEAERLAAAPAVYVTRSFDLRDEEVSRIHVETLAPANSDGR